ncbi:MAG: Gfo/Idh/MocA family oxidoreductase [Rhodobacteraceae bacterium]|jgi:predicted dehydrogenase|nr:Gfo/Idh/MocA family oxidoreductase [Paracoccaceae bacterium]
MTAPMRWGILGAAKIAETAVAPAIHMAEGAVLAALATRGHSARVDRFAARYPGLRLVQGYEALLADPGIDAVYIPLPNHMHVEWTERALAAGKHVLCEKPIAMQAGEIDRLIAARDAAGRLAAEAFMVVHHPQWQRARTLIAEGAIGALSHVEGVFAYNNAADPGNIRNRAETGGGGLPDIGVYPAITTRFATAAEPLRLRADIRWENGVDSFARVWADFPGFTASFYVSMRLALRQEMVFHGTDGWMRLAAPFNAGLYGEAQIEIRMNDGRRSIEAFPGVDQYRLMVEAFGRSAATGAPFACTLESSKANQAMIDAIFAAAAT